MAKTPKDRATEAAKKAMRALGVAATRVHSALRTTRRSAELAARKLAGNPPWVLPTDPKRVEQAPKLVPIEDCHCQDVAWGLPRSVRRTVEAALHGLAPAAEGLYALSLIDDRVLDGFMFASGHDADFSELLERADGIRSAETASAVGAVNRLAGCAAEQDVAVQMAEAGHAVVLSDAPNQAGYDLLVDGIPVQVKCVESAGAVHEHLASHPDIPVVVNVEVASQLEGVDGVIVDPELSHADVHERLEETVDGLDRLDEGLSGYVPLVPLITSAPRHRPAVLHERIPLSTGSTRIAVDGLVVGGCGLMGAKVGALVGSMLGPLVLVLGATFGAAAGAGAGRVGADAVNLTQMRHARDRAVHCLERLGLGVAKEVLPARLEGLLRKRQRSEDLWKQARRADSAPVEPASARLDEALTERIERHRTAMAYLVRYSKSASLKDRVHNGWVALTYAPHVFHPQLEERLTVVREALDGYRLEIGRVS